jgi:hypothetical protein
MSGKWLTIRRQQGAVMAKTMCPISRKEFLAHAKPIAVKIGELPLAATVKEFQTGSLGWFLNGKTSIDVNGTPVAVQIGLNITVLGSKDLPRE